MLDRGLVRNPASSSDLGRNGPCKKSSLSKQCSLAGNISDTWLSNSVAYRDNPIVGVGNVYVYQSDSTNASIRPDFTAATSAA